MRFRILGTLEVQAYGSRITLASPRQQRALAVLLLNAGAVVPVERMIDALWEDEPPVTAVKQVRNCVSALRGRLGEAGAMIVTDGPGYRLQLEPGDLDSLRFRRHVGRSEKTRPDIEQGFLVTELGERGNVGKFRVFAGNRDTAERSAAGGHHVRVCAGVAAPDLCGELAAACAGAEAVQEFIGDAPFLSDDFAPVDQLIGR